MPERITRVEQNGTGKVMRRCGARPPRAAFTLIDVLVTMAVIAVLISILSPALSSIRESARQVVCRSNVRQMGIGISLYAQENKDLIPSSVNAPNGPVSNASWETMDLRLDAVGGQPGNWDGLGRLYDEQILPAPKLFYCPSHHGNHPYADYSADWGGGSGGIVGNFQYRAAGLSQRRTQANPNGVHTTSLSLMLPQTALAADGMRTQEDFNHGIGANVLRAGLSVDWWRDPGNFIGLLPKDGQIPTGTMLEAWNSLDGIPPPL